VRALAHVQTQKAIVAMYSHRDRAAQGAFRAAIDGYGRLIAEFRKPAELENWGRSCLGLAVFLKTAGRSEESKALMEAASDRMRSLVQDQYTRWRRSADELLSRV